MNDAYLKESLVYYDTISCSDKNYKPELYKGSCETGFKSAIVTTKNHLTYHCTSRIPNYQQSIGT